MDTLTSGALQTRLTRVEKLSYAIGNFGVNLIFGMTGAYLLYFYTDVYNVAPAFVAKLFLLARGADAIFDPFLGLMIDRTSTRYGKHRPYLIALVIPFALCGAAVFATPALGAHAKAVYIFVSYTLLGMLYSGISLPLNSMLPTLTRDPNERTSTNVLREFLGTGSTVGVGYLTLPLVRLLGGGSQSKGFLLVAVAFGIIATVALLITFFNTRERIAPSKSPQILTTAQSLKAVRGNMPWVSTMLVNFFFWVGFISHVQSVIYYAANILGGAGIVPTLMLTMLVTLAGTGLSAVFANRIGKVKTGLIGSAIAALGTCALGLSHAEAWLIAMNCVAYWGLGLIGGLMFALMADAVDYGEWKSGFRAQGFLYAASSFGVKLGISIGGAAGAWLLGRSGYTAGAAVTPMIAASIAWSYIWIPTFSFAAMGASLLIFIVHPEYTAAERRRSPPSTPPIGAGAGL